mgnify:CR=1 FL=1
MSSLVEKFKNKKVFILYLVGVLLLSTSVSFAYFTSRTTSSGEGSVAVATTVDLFVEGLQAEGIIEFNNTDMYPGHIGIASIKLTGKGQNVPALYNLIFNGTNTFNTELKYTVYKTTTYIDVSYSCNVKQERMGVNTIYYEECTGKNIEQLGEVVSSGTIHNGEGKTTLKENEIMLTSPEGEEVYYYVVIEYPNEEENQNDDLGSTISGNITVEKLDYQYPEINMVGTTVSGNNGWVRSASINTTITTQTGNYEALYCTTTSDSCTPNTSATITDNSFSISLNNNSNAQKLCVRVTDEYNQVKEGCSEAYKVDGQVPTSSTTIASSTNGSNGWYQALSINAIGTDSHSGVSSIQYCTTTSSTCTPSTNVNGSSTAVTLNSNKSAQRVCTQATDTAGNTSTTTCSSAYSVDITNPTVSITSISSTENSISVTVSGSDSHSGIYQYKFSSNNGSSYTTVSSTNNSYTYTFNNLKAGTVYTIAVQSVDKSGRVSSKVTRSVTTEQAGDTMQTILADYNKSARPNTFPFYSPFSEETTKQVFTTTDWEGTSYYFAGSPTDNWVSFAGFYWRIIRINGNGSVRMIYQGASPNANGKELQIGISNFNVDRGSSVYVGLLYGGTQHGTDTKSIILDFLNSWYINSDLNDYKKYIDFDIGFCSYRDTDGNHWEAMPVEDLYYGGYYRLQFGAVPLLDCSNDDILKIPVGLITADEAVMGGLGSTATTTDNYLFTGENYWTMTPYGYLVSDGLNMVFQILSNGYVGSNYVSLSAGVRPVINLKADTLFTGSGTPSDPYTVVGAS